MSELGPWPAKHPHPSALQQSTMGEALGQARSGSKLNIQWLLTMRKPMWCVRSHSAHPMSELNTRAPLDRRSARKSPLKKEWLGATAHNCSQSLLICPPLACGGAERILMAASVSRYSSKPPKKLIVFPPTASVPVKVGSWVLLEKTGFSPPPPAHIGRLPCLLASQPLVAKLVNAAEHGC